MDDSHLLCVARGLTEPRYWTYRKSVVVKQAKRAQSQLGGSSAADRSHPSSVSVGA